MTDDIGPTSSSYGDSTVGCSILGAWEMVNSGCSSDGGGGWKFIGVRFKEFSLLVWYDETYYRSVLSFTLGAGSFLTIA